MFPNSLTNLTNRSRVGDQYLRQFNAYICPIKFKVTYVVQYCGALVFVMLQVVFVNLNWPTAKLVVISIYMYL